MAECGTLPCPCHQSWRTPSPSAPAASRFETRPLASTTALAAQCNTQPLPAGTAAPACPSSPSAWPLWPLVVGHPLLLKRKRVFLKK